MSEIPHIRPEIDDTSNGSWYLSFTVIAPGADTSIESYDRYSAVIATVDSEIRPMLSLDKDEATFSMSLENVTQKRALLIAYAHLLNAFENADQVGVIKEARMALRVDVEAAIRDGKVLELEDISLDAIDLDRELTAIRDL